MDLESGNHLAALRASDDDREGTVSVLRQHHASGRLTIEELTERVHRARRARTLGDLDHLSSDLPLLPVLPHLAVVARRRWRQHLLGYTWTGAFLVLVWVLGSAAAGQWTFFWPIWPLLGWGLVVGAHTVQAFWGPATRTRLGQEPVDLLPRVAGVVREGRR